MTRWGWNYRLAWIMARTAGRIFGRWQLKGIEKVPLEGPLIVASNHASFADPPMIGGAMPRPICYLARQTLFDPPLFGRYIASLNAFPLDREGDSRAALRICCQKLEEGWAVLLFPEGTRTRTGRLGEIKDGVGTIATRSGAAVLPVYLWGSYQCWPRNRLLPWPHRLKVLVGDPIAVRSGLRGSERKEEQERVTAAVRAALHALEDEAYEGEAEPVPLPADVPALPASESSVTATEVADRQERAHDDAQ